MESARKCQITSGAIPGYKAGEDKRFYTDPINAAAVLEIFQRYDGGELLMHIMDDLNKKGIRSHKGKPPHPLVHVFHPAQRKIYRGVHIRRYQSRGRHATDRPERLIRKGAD